MTALDGGAACTSDPPHSPAGGRDHRLQRGRGGGRACRRHQGVVVGADRLRTRLRGRDLVGGRRRLAVLGHDPETREKTALRFIAFSFFALAAYVTVDAVRALAGVGEARPSAVGIVLAALSLAIMPVLSLAQRRAGRELGSRLSRRRFQADAAVHLPVRDPACRPGAQQRARLVVGRPGRGARHRRDRSARRRQRMARRPVLLMNVQEGPDGMPIIALVLFAVFAATRIRLAQLGTAAPHRIHRVPRHHRSPGFDRVVAGVGIRRRRWVWRCSRRSCSCSAWCRRWASCTRHGSRSPAPSIAVLGIAATVYAQLDMGDSWRIGVDQERDDDAGPNGVFGWVRNPIFTAMMTFGLGIALLTPNLVASSVSCSSSSRSSFRSAPSRSPTCWPRTATHIATTSPASAASFPESDASRTSV